MIISRKTEKTERDEITLTVDNVNPYRYNAMKYLGIYLDDHLI